MAGTLLRAQAAAFLALCAVALALAAPVRALTAPADTDSAATMSTVPEERPAAAPRADAQAPDGDGAVAPASPLAPGDGAAAPMTPPAPGDGAAAPAPAASLLAPPTVEPTTSAAPALPATAALATRAAAAPAPPAGTPEPLAADPPATPAEPAGATVAAAAEAATLPPGCAIDLILGVTPIIGTGGDDTLTGTPGDDFICGLGGNDTIDGLAGDDRIDGGAGNDTIHGGAGDDVLGGGAGDDAIYGDAGDDCLGGGEGDDLLVGGAGADRLDGGIGHDIVRGGDVGTPGTDGHLVQSPDTDAWYTPGGCSPFGGFPIGSAPGLDAVLGGIIDEAKALATRVAGLGADAARAAERRPLAVRPLRRPERIVDGAVKLKLICRANFTTSEGTVRLRTFPTRADPRDLGGRTDFACSPRDSTPEVTIELPKAEQRLVEQLGRLRVMAVAEARTSAGAAETAVSHFTLLPERP